MQKGAVAAVGRRRMTQSGSLIRGIMLTEEMAGETMSGWKKNTKRRPDGSGSAGGDRLLGWGFVVDGAYAPMRGGWMDNYA